MSQSRRLALKSALSASAAVFSTTLPDRWIRPVVDSVLLPAHAQASAVDYLIECAGGQPTPGTVVPSDSILTSEFRIIPNPGVITVTARAFCGNDELPVLGTNQFETDPDGTLALVSEPSPAEIGCPVGTTFSHVIEAGGVTGTCSWTLGAPAGVSAASRAQRKRGIALRKSAS